MKKGRRYQFLTQRDAAGPTFFRLPIVFCPKSGDVCDERRSKRSNEKCR